MTDDGCPLTPDPAGTCDAGSRDNLGEFDTFDDEPADCPDPPRSPAARHAAVGCSSSMHRAFAPLLPKAAVTSENQAGSELLPHPRLRRMARAFNCPQIASDPLGPVVTEFLDSLGVGTRSQSNPERLTVLQGHLVEQEQKYYFGLAPFDERT